jgi:hypothetical protein
MAAVEHVPTFSFQSDGYEPLTLEAAVYQAIGAASVCWEHIGKAGTFNDDWAREIGEALLEFVRGRVTELLADGTPVFVGTPDELRHALYEDPPPADRVAVYRVP